MLKTGHRILWVYLYLFFMLFGPKLGTYIDTSVIASFFVIMIFACKNNYRIPFDGMLKKLIIVLLGIVLYSAFVSLLNVFVDVVFYGRMVRTLFSIMGVYVFCTYSTLDMDEMQNCMINVIIIHAITVIITATIFVDWQNVLRGFTAYDKHIRQYRSTGLLAGFDMAGLVCNLGLMLTLVNKKFSILKYIIFIVAIMFTSRFSLVLLVCILLAYLFFIRGGVKKSFVKSVVLITVVFAVIFVGCLLMLTTTNIISGKFDFGGRFESINNFAMMIKEAYAKSDAVKAFSEQYKFSSEFSEIILGKGVYGGGDPGYVKIINCIGVFGLVLVLVWHGGLLIRISKQRLKSYQKKNARNYILVIFMCVLIGLNFKNCYFFTGTFFEIMMFELYLWNRYYYQELTLEDKGRQE